jgi:hypothetical protein
VLEQPWKHAWSAVRADRRYSRPAKIRQLILCAWECNNSIPFRRIQAAARAVNVFISLEDLQSALQLAQDAIDLLPAVSNRSLQRADQQYAVSHFSGLAASACSLFLLRNQPEQALEVLEEDGLPFLANLSVTGATSQHWTTHIPMWLIGFKTFLLRLMPL